MTGFLKYRPLEGEFTDFADPGFGGKLRAGFLATFGKGVLARGQAEREVFGAQQAEMEPWQDFLRDITSGENTISEETVTRLQEADFLPDPELWGEVIEEARGLGYEPPQADLPRRQTDIASEVYGRYGRAVALHEETLAKAGPVEGLLYGLVGGFAAEMTDPFNVATMPIGAPSRVGFLSAMAIEAAVNSMIEVAQSPSRNAWLDKMGLERESILQNALFGAGFGAGLTGLMRGGARALDLVGRMTTGMAGRTGKALTPAQQRALADAGRAADDPEIRGAAQAVTADLDQMDRAVTNPGREAAAEHTARAQAAAEAAETGVEPPMPDRPAMAVPERSYAGGDFEEVDPLSLEVQPDVFQFKSDIVAEGGVTPKLQGVTEWVPERGGIAIVFEYADGRRAIADGHQRVALARRIMANDPRQKITLMSRVFREADGFSADDVRVIAALKNIAEAADGMTTRMSRDAAKVLRVRPEAIADMPTGPGIARARALSNLGDEAFGLYINEVIPERFAELVGRMVDEPDMQLAMVRLLEKVEPETTTQAESIIRQALEAPVAREMVADLFGERSIAESLYLERAKVLDRAMAILRDDRSVFRTLTEREGRITEAGRNVLDTRTNKAARAETEAALVTIQKLAHRAGPISEALNDGAKRYKESGRLKDAAEAVADIIRREVRRNGGVGDGTGAGGRAAKSQGASAKAPDPNAGFADPVAGEGVKAQIEATRIEAEPVARASEATPAGEQALIPGVDPISPRDRLEMAQARPLVGGERAADSEIGGLFDPNDPARSDLFDAVPVGVTKDADGNPVSVVKTRGEVAAELDAMDEAVSVLEACVK